MRILAGAAFAMVVGLTAPVASGERPKAVVELFTSQGCNSCPPADANLRRIADGGDIIALAYHVDYWDYLGWKDTLASPANTERQRSYSRAFGSRSVYTPQAVVNGRMDLNGAAAIRLDAAINQLGSGDQALTVDVDIERNGDTIGISTGDWPGGYVKAQILLVIFRPVSTVTVKRGENAGQTLVYRNAVTRVQAAGMWKGRSARWEIPASEVGQDNGAAVLVQAMRKDGALGPVLGAAILSGQKTAD